MAKLAPSGLRLLLAAAFVSAPNTKSSADASRASVEALRPLNEVLHEVLVEVGVEQLCDKGFAAGNRKTFFHLYGSRINRLRARYDKWHGPDEPLTIIGSCRLISDSAEFEERTAQAIERFAKKLDRLEVLYEKGPLTALRARPKIRLSDFSQL